MSITNDFLPFGYTGSNIESQADYVIDPNRPIGNQPGIASSKFANKTFRQSAAVTSQFAQYIGNLLNVNMVDDGISTNLLAQIMAALTPIGPQVSIFGSGSGTFTLNYFFFTAPCNATSGDVYSNNSVNFTVQNTVVAGQMVQMSGSGAPLISGTLTKVSGSGDAAIAFLAVRAPKYLDITMNGAGAGGTSSGAGSIAPGTGNPTTFGSLLTAGGGLPGSSSSGFGGIGGTFTITGPAIEVEAYRGAQGNCGQGASGTAGGNGGSLIGGAGSGGNGVAGQNAYGTTGAGGGGGGYNATSGTSGYGGGSGARIRALIYNPSSIGNFAYQVGTAGVHGSGGSGGFDGGDGATGFLSVTAVY